MGNQVRQIEDVRGAGIYPATGPLPHGHALVPSPAELGHPERRKTSHMSLQSIATPALVDGRAIFGGYFLYNGINHLVNREMLPQYAQSKGVPSLDAAVVGSGLLAIAGGLSLLTGLWPKVGAGLISTFLLGLSPRMHAFWREEDQQRRMQETINFTKNMALVGPSLLAAARPQPWPLALNPGGGQMIASSR